MSGEPSILTPPSASAESRSLPGWELLAWAHVTVGPTLVLAWLAAFFTDRELARQLAKDDHAIEWMTVVFLLLAAAVCARLAWTWRSLGSDRAMVWIFAILALASFFIAGEEISWGQRLLGLTVPKALVEVNAQKELNLHNLEIFQRWRHWLLIAFGSVGLLLMAMPSHWLGTGPWRGRWTLLRPSPTLSLNYMLVLLTGGMMEISSILKSVRGTEAAIQCRFWVGRLSESVECVVGLTAFFFALDVLRRVKRRAAEIP